MFRILLRKIHKSYIKKKTFDRFMPIPFRKLEDWGLDDEIYQTLKEWENKALSFYHSEHDDKTTESFDRSMNDYFVAKREELLKSGRYHPSSLQKDLVDGIMYLMQISDTGQLP